MAHAWRFTSTFPQVRAISSAIWGLQPVNRSASHRNLVCRIGALSICCPRSQSSTGWHMCLPRMTTRRRITHILAEHPLSTPESCVSCNTYMKINKIHASIDSTTLIPASAMTEVSRRQYAHVPFLARQKHYSRKSLLGQSSWLAVVRFQREGLIRRSLETAGATKSGWLGDYCYRHEGRIKESRRITLLCSIGESWKEQRTVTNCRRWEREGSG